MSKHIYSFFSLEKNTDESKLKKSIFLFLDKVTIEEKQKVIDYIIANYKKTEPSYGYRELIGFFEENYGTYIWDIAFKKCFAKENYEELSAFDKGNWEIADIAGEYVGQYFIEKMLLKEH